MSEIKCERMLNNCVDYQKATDEFFRNEHSGRYPWKESKVYHPRHYTFGEIEVIDYCRDKLSYDQFLGFCLGNILKYVSRWEHKDGVEDLKKAEQYLKWAIKWVESEESKAHAVKPKLKESIFDQAKINMASDTDGDMELPEVKNYQKELKQWQKDIMKRDIFSALGKTANKVVKDIDDLLASMKKPVETINQNKETTHEA